MSVTPSTKKDRSDLLPPPAPMSESKQKELRIQRLLAELDNNNAALAEGLQNSEEIATRLSHHVQDFKEEIEAQKKSIIEKKKRDEKNTRILVVACLILALFMLSIVGITLYFLKLT